MGNVEAIGKLRSGSPLPGGGAPVAAVDYGGSLKHKADKEDVRGKLVRRKRGSEVRLTERRRWQRWRPRLQRDGVASDVQNQRGGFEKGSAHRWDALGWDFFVRARSIERGRQRLPCADAETREKGGNGQGIWSCGQKEGWGWGPVMCHDVWNYRGGRGPGGRQKRGPARGGGRSGGVARTGEEEGGRSGLVDRYGPAGVDRSEMNIGFFELF
jgi:hypothetical protein